VIAIVAGLTDASETFHGIFIVPEDPVMSAKLSAALTPDRLAPASPSRWHDGI
jgi:hypothetical protein